MCVRAVLDLQLQQRLEGIIIMIVNIIREFLFVPFNNNNYYKPEMEDDL